MISALIYIIMGSPALLFKHLFAASFSIKALGTLITKETAIIKIRFILNFHPILTDLAGKVPKNVGFFKPMAVGLVDPGCFMGKNTTNTCPPGGKT